MKATECKQKHKSHWFIHLLPAHIHTPKFRKVSRFAWRTEKFYDSSRCVCAFTASAWSEEEKINWKIKVGFISLRFMAGICLEVRWIRFESLSAKQCFAMWWWAGKRLRVDEFADGRHQTSVLRLMIMDLTQVEAAVVCSLTVECCGWAGMIDVMLLRRVITYISYVVVKISFKYSWYIGAYESSYGIIVIYILIGKHKIKHCWNSLFSLRTFEVLY